MNYAENKIKIYGKDALIIIGTTDNKFNFMRLYIDKNNIYENIVKFKSKREEKPFNYILKIIEEKKYRMNYGIKKNQTINKNIIIFEYNLVKSKNPLVQLTLIKKINDNEKFIIINEESVKSLYNFNKIYYTNIDDDKIINLYHKYIGDEGFKKLSNIKLRVYKLILRGINLSDISPLNPDNLRN